MRTPGILIFLAGVGSTTAYAVPAASVAPVATAKTVAQFGECFVTAQFQESRPWSFVPTHSGGTFSNAGGRGATKAYYLTIRDRGPVRQLRLESASRSTSIDPAIARAITRCA